MNHIDYAVLRDALIVSLRLKLYAVGDGAADDTEAIQSLVNDSVTLSRETVKSILEVLEGLAGEPLTALAYQYVLDDLQRIRDSERARGYIDNPNRDQNWAPARMIAADSAIHALERLRELA